MSRGKRRGGDFTKPVSFRMRVQDWDIIERLATEQGLSVGQFASEQMHNIARRADRPTFTPEPVSVKDETWQRQEWSEADARRLGERNTVTEDELRESVGMEHKHDYRPVARMPGLKRCTLCGKDKTS